MTDFATLETITNFFLYGSATKPTELEDRLRSLPANYELGMFVETAAYMSSIGRYGYPSKSAIIQDFFNGAMPKSYGVASEGGTVRLTVADYLAKTGTPAESLGFGVSHYTLDTASSDYKERAFIWGSTTLSINADAVFVWDAEGQHVENLRITPFKYDASDDNFNFKSDNPVVENLFETVLKSSIDPYGIGRTLAFEFTAGPGTVISSYTSDAFALDRAKTIQEAATGGDDIVAALSAAATLFVEVAKAGSVDYYHDGKFIIYGSGHDDILSAASAKGPLASLGVQHVSGLALVAGGGNDVVSGGLFSDLIYGGAGVDRLFGGLGDDVIHGGADNDFINALNPIIGGNDTVFGDGGDDHILADGGTLYGGTGADKFWIEKGSTVTISDLDASDSIYWNGYKLGAAAYRLTDVEVTYDWDTYYPEFQIEGVLSTAEGVVYKLTSDKVITATMSDGTKIIVDNFEQGKGGITFDTLFQYSVSNKDGYMTLDVEFGQGQHHTFTEYGGVWNSFDGMQQHYFNSYNEYENSYLASWMDPVATGSATAPSELFY